MTDAATPTVDPVERPDAAMRVYRIEIHPKDPGDDPVGSSTRGAILENHLAASPGPVHAARLYLIESSLDEATITRIADELLADPVNQRFTLGSTPVADGSALAEVHYLPGVMDPVADSTADAIREMLDAPDLDLLIRTGYRYDLENVTRDEAATIANRLLANTVIQRITHEPYHPESFPHGQPYQLHLTHVPIRDLTDDELKKLSREGHLFLSLEEMQAVQRYYREAEREPTDIELETLAQTWSEHCVHKTLKSNVSYTESDPAGPGPGPADWLDRPGHRLADDGTLIIDNLLKSTIAAATNQLIADGLDWCISVFVDNAGIIAFDETDAVTFKVETHNRPSAIEPYGGAATGAGGCIRDTLGTGLAALPIANTDIFCVADPTLDPADLPKGVLHPRRILSQVVAGVRDYGNRMGIPTVNGAVFFDDRYLGNPLVFCGSVGVIPNDKAFGHPQPGDRIIALGGRTGRDGIHGATFSSAELTDTHADEFSHAVQIGNAITEKKVLDVIMQARDHETGCLYSAITDCGAGGFSSAVGEMGEKLGAAVHLNQAPLKYDGLSYTEIWISEAQERMVLAVPAEKVQTLRDLAASEDVELCDLGHFGTEGSELILHYAGTEVGRLAMSFIHDGIPQPTRTATWTGPAPAPKSQITNHKSQIAPALLTLLSHPNIASKHWIIRQYDHEVQGTSVVKPLVGPQNDGPSDAAVVKPKLDSPAAVALSCGLATWMGDLDPYWMTLAAIDEAVRNAVCVGADPSRVAILDNFCWAKCDRPHNLGALVRAAEACYDGAMAYRTPFISGKDSLNNEFTREDGSTIAIPPTLLISAIGLVHDATRCVTMNAKQPGNLLIQIGLTTDAIGGSHAQRLTGLTGNPDLPRVDLRQAPAILAAVASLIADGHVASAHDCSEGGMLVAAAEMAFAGRLGLSLDLDGMPRHDELPAAVACFAETPSRILLEISPAHFDHVARRLTAQGVPFGQIGRFDETDRLTLRSGTAGRLADLKIEDLLNAWLKPLDW